MPCTLILLGRAGLTEEEVGKSGRRAPIGRRPIMKVGRAVEKGETQGFMKIIVDAQTHEILGAAIPGPGGYEAIHSILEVMYAKAPYSVIQRAVHIHPAVYPDDAWRTPTARRDKRRDRSVEHEA